MKRKTKQNYGKTWKKWRKKRKRERGREASKSADTTPYPPSNRYSPSFAVTGLSRHRNLTSENFIPHFHATVQTQTSSISLLNTIHFRFLQSDRFVFLSLFIFLNGFLFWLIGWSSWFELIQVDSIDSIDSSRFRGARRFVGDEAPVSRQCPAVDSAQSQWNVRRK